MTLPDRTVSLRIAYDYPERTDSRETDPHYRAFEAYKRQLKVRGAWRCAVPGCVSGAEVELHHRWVPWAMAGAVDPVKVGAWFGVTLVDDEALARWIASPANLVPLCELHHTGVEGAHWLPHADWLPNALRRHTEPVVWKLK